MSPKFPQGFKMVLKLLPRAVLLLERYNFSLLVDYSPAYLLKSLIEHFCDVFFQIRGTGLILGTEFTDNKSPNEPFPPEWGKKSI